MFNSLFGYLMVCTMSYCVVIVIDQMGRWRGGEAVYHCLRTTTWHLHQNGK